MAIPGSGALGILTCPGGVACTAISGVVCGTVTGPQSLCNMFIIAGQSIPGTMTNFHGSIYGDLCVLPATINSISNAGATCAVLACSYSPNTFTVATACTWLHPAAPSAPSIAGTSQNITIDANAGAARQGTVCYTPSHCGSVQTITLCQVAGVTWKCIYVGSVGGTSCGSLTTTCQCGIITATPAMSAGECYCGTFCIANSVTTGNGGGADGYIVCNGTVKLHCCTTAACGTGCVAFVVTSTDTVCLCALAHTPSAACTGCACSRVYIGSISSIVGSECYGGGCCCVNTFTA